MSFINRCYQRDSKNRSFGIGFLKLLHPICPHITEEIALYWKLDVPLVTASWPKYNSQDLIVKEVNVVLQINGNLKALLKMPIDSNQEETIAKAKAKLSDFLINVKIDKIIFVQNKIVNFVVNNY